MNNKVKNIEIEIRGPLSEKEYIKLERYLRKNGHFKQNKDRVLIDYSLFLSSEGLESRENDIRLRITNKIPEIIIKTGKMGGTESRKETSVLVRKGNFDKLVQIFAILGLTKGVLCVRKGRIYVYKDIEFSLIEVPGHSFYFEAEKLISEGENKEQVQKDIIKFCKKLKLRLFTDKSFFSYIKKLNRETNEIFDYKKYKEDYFKDKFNF